MARRKPVEEEVEEEEEEVSQEDSGDSGDSGDDAPGMYDDEDDEDESDAEEAALELAALQKLGTVLGTQPRTEKKEYKNDEAALKEKIDEIHLRVPGTGKNIPWDETLHIVCPKPVDCENPHDDIAREGAFYKQALESVQEAVRRFETSGFKYRRPDDYYAEMVKDDNHMAKVKAKLEMEQRQITEAEERRKRREFKKYSKQIQAEKEQSKIKAKKSRLDAVQQWKKDRKGGNNAVDDEFDISLMDQAVDGGKKGEKRQRGQPPVDHRGAKRKFKDQKYGFGGKKKRAKSNTTESTDDAKSGWGKMRYEARKAQGKAGFGPMASKGAGGKGGAKAKSAQKKKRLGKARRKN